MRVAERKVDLTPLHLRPESYPADVQLPLPAARHAFGGIRKDRPSQAVQAPGPARVVGASHQHLSVLHLNLDLRVRHPDAELAFGPLELDLFARDRRLDLVGQLDRQFSNSTHTFLSAGLVDGADQLASYVLLARLLIHHHPLGGRKDRYPQAAEHPGNVPARHVTPNPRLPYPLLSPQPRLALRPPPLP